VWQWSLLLLQNARVKPRRASEASEGVGWNALLGRRHFAAGASRNALIIGTSHSVRAVTFM
jgi:hypothetical protein